MQLLRAERVKKDFKQLPTEIQRRVAKALELFLANSRHPSLHVKKMEGAPDIWARHVTDHYRMTFQFVQEGVLLRRVGTHNVLRQP